MLKSKQITNSIILLAFIFLIVFQNSSIDNHTGFSDGSTPQQSFSWLDYNIPSFFDGPVAKLQMNSDGDRVYWNMHFYYEGNMENLAGKGSITDLYAVKLLQVQKATNFSFARGEYYSSSNPYPTYSYYNFSFTENDFTTVVPKTGAGFPIHLNDFFISGKTNGFLIPSKELFIAYANGGYLGLNLSYTGIDVVNPGSCQVIVKSETNGTQMIVDSINSATPLNKIMFFSEYNLDTSLVLNSTYFSRNNIKVYYYTNGAKYDSNYDYLKWVESTDTIFKLKSPWYKLRITDLQGNLLFEDSTFQEYSRFRYLDLNSLRIQNNANEPIITDLYQNHGYYQGALSFDNDTINLPPVGYQSVYTTHSVPTVIKEQSNHSKILNFTCYGVGKSVKFDFASSTSLEYWFYPLTQTIGGYWNMVMWNSEFTWWFNDDLTRLYAFDGVSYFYSTTSISLNTWNHIRLSIDSTNVTFYLNNIAKTSFAKITDTFSSLTISNDDLASDFYLDAIDYSSSSGYYFNRNTELNHTGAIYEIIANQNYNHTGHYQGALSFDNDIVNTIPSCLSYNQGLRTPRIINYYQNHNKVLEFKDDDNVLYSVADLIITPIVNMNFEFWWNFYANTTNPYTNFMLITFMQSNYASLAELSLNYNAITHTQGAILFNNGTNPILVNSGNYCNQNEWYHIRLSFNDATDNATIFINGTNFGDFKCKADINANIAKIRFNTRGEQSNSNYTHLFDAIDYSNSDYFINRNLLENQSTNLESWNTYPRWESGYYQDASITASYYGDNSTNCGIEIVDFANRKNLIHMFKDQLSPESCTFSLSFSEFTTGSFSYWLYDNRSNPVAHSYFNIGTHSFYYANGLFSSITDGWVTIYNGPVNVWNYLNYQFNSTHLLFYVNNELQYNTTYTTTVNYAAFYLTTSSPTEHNDTSLYFDAYDYSTASNFFIKRNMLENTTASMLELNYTAAPNYQYNPFLSLQTNPYSYSLTNFTSGFYLYRHLDLYSNQIDAGTMVATENELVFTPANVREIFISIHDQQSNYLNWEQFKIRINGTLIYENRFYREIGTTWNISIYNQYGLYLTSTLHTVSRDENYVPLQLIKRSLKIYNQQEQFLHVNITYDPNYYSYPYFWSTWLAPKESTEYFLIQDYYRVAISNFENGSAVQYFAYNLINDDILMISSSNTLYNVLANMNNMNTSIANQFTYVALNFTNTNSQIGNQTILLEINFENQNTTLGQMLLSQQNSFDFYNSSFNTLFINQESNFSMFQSNLSNIYLLANNNFQTMNTSLGLISVMNQNSFNAINTSIDELLLMGANSFYFTNGSLNQIIAQNQNSFSFINSSVDDIKTMNQNTFSFLNSSVSNLYALSENSFVFMNSSVAALTTQSLNSFEFLNSSVSSIYALSILSFEALNSSFDNLNLNMLQNFSFTNSLINQNQLQLMTQFSFVDSNISQLGIDIDTKLVTLNSTITNLTAELSNYVLLVNNSIYTAVLESAAALELQGNLIRGDLNMTFVQNEYLTQILQETMFSKLLNWTGVNYNYSIIEAQIDKFSFINKNNNDTYELFLKYKDQMEQLIIGAQDFREIQLPATDVEYRVKSINTGEYLDEWKPLSNETIELGFLESDVPEVLLDDTPLWFKVAFFTILCFGSVAVSILLFLWVRAKSTKNQSINDIYETQIYRNGFRR